jgi:hypothetical protein
MDWADHHRASELSKDKTWSSMCTVQVDQLVFKELVDVRFPRLSGHLEGHGVNVSSVSTNWFLCIFVNSLPLESCLRVWDIFFLECCSSVLFRVALALVDIYSQVKPTRLHHLTM